MERTMYRVTAKSPDHEPTTLDVEASLPFVAIQIAEARLVHSHGWTREECQRSTFHASVAFGRGLGSGCTIDRDPS